MDDTKRLGRRRLLRLSSAGIAASLAGCSGSGGDDTTESPDGDGGTDQTTQTATQTENPSDPIHVLTDYNTEAWQKRWEDELVPGFKQETGNEVDVEYSGFQGKGEQRLQTLIQAGDAPEIFHAAITQMGGLALGGRLASVNGVNEYTAEQNGGLIAPIPAYQGTELVAVTALYANITHNYRADVYDQLSLSKPGTWSAWLDNLESIAEDSDIEARGIAVPGQKVGQGQAFFRSLLRANDASVFGWGDDDETVLSFPEEKVVETLEYVQQLGEYSPDPSSISWGPSLKFYAGGRVVHMSSVSPWGAGVAYAAGVDSIAKNTEIFASPKNDGTSPPDRGLTQYDGAGILSDSSRPEAAKEFHKYMFANPDRTAKNLLTDPMRWLSPFPDIFENDTYTNADIFQAYDGHLLKLMKEMRDEQLPQLDNRDVPRGPVSWYVFRAPILPEMLNQVLVVGDSPQKAYDDAAEKFETRIQEAKEKLPIDV